MVFIAMVSPNRRPTPHFPPLAGQDSFHLDEVNNQQENSRKSLDDMDLDELVKSVIAAEQNQVVYNAASCSSSSSSSSTANFHGNLNLSRTSSRRTVDEVWKEIVGTDYDVSVQRQPTLGENTIEDFLVRSGAIDVANQDDVVNAKPLAAIDPMVEASQQTDWLQFQTAAVQQQSKMAILGSTMPHSVSILDSSAINAGYPDNQLFRSMQIPSVLATLAETHEAVARKRRFSAEMMEKNIEQRQKRMIKNRESAARSRARKQAHIIKLESDVVKLKEENEEHKREKEIRMLFPSTPDPVPRYQLRRTSSAPF